MAVPFPGATPEAIWIVGRLKGEGTQLSFPAETEHPLIQVTEEDLAGEHDIATFVVVPVFYDPEALEQDPDLFAVTVDGNRAEDDWVQFGCPSRREYRRSGLRPQEPAGRRRSQQ